MTFLTFASASYLFKIQISRFVILFSLLGGTLLHLMLRWTFLRIAKRRLERDVAQERWLVLSSNGESLPSVEEFAKQNEALTVYARLPNQESIFVDWIKEIIFQITLGKFNKLLLSSTEGLSPDQIENLLWVVQQTDADFVVHDNLGLATAQNEVRHFQGLNWLSIGAPQINGSLRVLKRMFDLMLVTPSLIVLLPFFAIIAVGVKIDSPGRLLYTQRRIGQDGQTFTFPKFRSMREGSDLDRLEVLGRPDESMAMRYRADPRITRFGRFLRRFSLDELPQLWCVLIGTMSLVGPRPILPEEETQLGEFHFRRHIAKPGLTGIWQVSGRKETTWEERMAFDIKYVQEWSIALDLILIARTFKSIISGRGSY
jgi:exopolysaccharide biosynthesis polyprenyl glycosylphosphotransferase